MTLRQPADGDQPVFHGVYPAVVTDIVDPDSLGRVQVRLPWLGEEGDRNMRFWATLCSPYADADQGLLALPEVGSQVLVAFGAGNLSLPYVIGATWNGREALPHQPEAANNVRLLRTRSDSRLEFDDTRGAEKIRITTASGHEVTLDNAAQSVTVRHAGGSTVKLTTTGVEVTATTVTVNAATVKVDAAMSTFTGVVKAATFIADAMVTSPAYSPGAGNVW
jgi:uncharacterized protein involved in type VI secretion and phage assembly